jgi:hypothetical protein
MVAPPKPARKRPGRPRKPRPDRRRGGKPHIPTPESRSEVRTLAGIVGLPQPQIAMTLGISEVTLRKHYRIELDTAKIRMDAAVGQTYMAKCLGGFGQERRWQDADTTALIWYTKARMGWTDRTAIDLAGGVELRLGRDFKDI